jgi:AcrR family transcriptional regulator
MSVTRTRLAPAARREQLLDLGREMVSQGRLDDVSIDSIAEQAGISRGLLYHYFPNKREFRLAVLRRMADEILEVTAPRAADEPVEQLALGLAAYVDFVIDNHAAYLSFVRGAAGGDEDFQEIHEQSRHALTDRIFTTADPELLAGMGLVDTPVMRLVVRGWSALVEEMLLDWIERPQGISRETLLEVMANALTGLGAVVSPTR